MINEDRLRQIIREEIEMYDKQKEERLAEMFKQVRARADEGLRRMTEWNRNSGMQSLMTESGPAHPPTKYSR